MLPWSRWKRYKLVDALGIQLNSRNRYSLDYSCLRFFTIDEMSGQVKVGSDYPLDYEVEEQRNLDCMVTARDSEGSSQSRSGTAGLTLNVTDTDDTPPQFVGFPVSFSCCLQIEIVDIKLFNTASHRSVIATQK